jgi:hypothetical protein
VAKLSSFEKKTLAKVIEATNAGSFVYLVEGAYQSLVEAGLVEVNLEIVNEEGEVATRAILANVAETIEEVNIPVIEPTKTKENAKMSFEIESNIPVPVTKRGGKRESAYPFAALEVNQSFFIPASEKHPEPAKSLASTVSGATKRFDVLVFEADGTTPKMKEVTNPKTKEVRTVQETAHTRTFKIVADEKDGVKGGRVFRTK